MTPEGIKRLLLSQGYNVDVRDTYAKYMGKDLKVFSVREDRVECFSYWRSGDEHRWNLVHNFKIMDGSSSKYVHEILNQHGFIELKNYCEIVDGENQ